MTVIHVVMFGFKPEVPQDTIKDVCIKHYSLRYASCRYVNRAMLSRGLLLMLKNPVGVRRYAGTERAMHPSNLQQTIYQKLVRR